jgi:hypothetical protein
VRGNKPGRTVRCCPYFICRKDANRQVYRSVAETAAAISHHVLAELGAAEGLTCSDGQTGKTSNPMEQRYN